MLRLGTAISVAAFFIALTWPAPASAQVPLDCDYFNFWEQAQAVYEEDETDPNFLDEDGDGIACPDLPEAGLDPVMPELPASGDYSCVDFPYQEMAQEIYDEDPTDPYNLDPTGDGYACSRLPLLADFVADEEFAADEGLTDDEVLEDEFADDPFADDELTDEELTDEELSSESVEGDTESAGPLTEEEREARRAARRAARQAEREAATEETPAADE